MKFHTLVGLSVLALFSLTVSAGPLKSNLKLASKTKANTLPRQAIVLQEGEISSGDSEEHLLQQDDPVFKYYVKPFSSSESYDFLDSFLLGLKLETFFKGSDLCIQDIVYAVDDGFYLYNNITDFSWNSMEAPVMNFSKMIAGNMTSSLVDCTIMAQSAYDYGVTKYT